jgi:hypothetical protein
MRRPLQCAAAATVLLVAASFQLSSPATMPSKRLRPLPAAVATCDSSFDLLTAPLQRDDDGKIQLKGCSFAELKDVMVSLGQRPERATDFFRWFYGDGHLIDNTGADLAAKELSKSFREALLSVCSVSGGLEFQAVHNCEDGTKKLLLTITNGAAKGNTVETVIIPMLQGPQRKPRYTLCVSSQVGCRQNCQFCFTGIYAWSYTIIHCPVILRACSVEVYACSTTAYISITSKVFLPVLCGCLTFVVYCITTLSLQAGWGF